MHSQGQAEKVIISRGEGETSSSGTGGVNNEKSKCKITENSGIELKQSIRGCEKVGSKSWREEV